MEAKKSKEADLEVQIDSSAMLNFRKLLVDSQDEVIAMKF